MKVGFDFDNTILNYDKVFAYLSKVEFGYEFEKFNKSQIRKKIINKKGEKEWMRLQGLAYGKFIFKAEINQGVQNLIYRLLLNNYKVYIVSHKTKYGHFDKSRINLRLQALKWLTLNSVINNKQQAIRKKNIFFADSIIYKINKINELKLNYFIDDLPY